MKAWMALLCLLPLVSSAATPTHIQTCTTTPNATGANQLIGCPSKNVVWGPAASTDLVRVIKPDSTQGWIPFNTLTPQTQVVPQTGGWAAFGTLTVTVPAVPPIGPVQTTHVYVLVWGAVTTRVDGSPLTDLTGYLTQTGPSVAGPWGEPQTVTTTTASYVLPSNVPQCFQVVAVSQASGSSDPATLCVPAIPVMVKPAAPVNVKAS
jgi:hypothetical protein